MGASTQAPFTFLATVHACTYSEVWKLVWVYIGPLKKILFSSTHQNSALFKSYYWLLKCVCTFMYVACMCMQISLPNFFWCIFDAYLNIIPIFVKIRGHLVEKLMCAHCSKCVHIFTCCACTPACGCTQILSINWGDQFEYKLEVWWWSDFIWLIYWGIMWQTDSVTE